jgi:diguanylate cyclase (GGDEF)-like protein
VEVAYGYAVKGNGLFMPIVQNHRNNIVNLLIIEDDLDDVYLIKEYLKSDEHKNYQYHHAKSLSSALEQLTTTKLDLILLDLGLPDAEGFESLTLLNQADSSIPIVVLTGVNDDEVGREAIQNGAEDYIPKAIANTLLLSRSINYAIERHRLLLELKAKAELDPLTGLPNRTMIYDKLDFMIHQSERSGQDFSLVMLDFDKFKEINDTYGHRYGDRLLQAFADRLKNLMRISDYVSRYGGDEFFMIVSNYQSEDELQELLMRKQEKLCQPYLLVLDDKEVEQSISISFGVMKWVPGMTANEMLEMADQAMYRSKRSEHSAMTFF